MKQTITIIAAIASLYFAVPWCCTKPSEATRVLQRQGYTDITITGWRPFAKAEGDAFSTGFRAKSPTGSTVSGTVSSGILKGATVRFD